MEILHQGVEQKQFRNNIDLKLVREIIFGTLDAVAMSCVLTNEIEQSSENWEDIIAILFRMLEPPRNDKADLPKDLQIIQAAERVFGEYGFRKSKILAVANEAGVAEGSIYDRFKNKDYLLFSLIQLRLDELDSQIGQPFTIKKSVRKLARLFKLHFSLFTKNRNFLNIFILDTVLNRKFYESSAHETFRNYQNRFLDVLNEGIQNGDFRQDLNTRVFIKMFIGTSIHMALRWIVFPDKPFDKLYEIDAVTEMFIAATHP
jgi:TetR/AcrR family fatty acid metabolism transcriptional regulator